MAEKKKTEELSFEEALARLEKIVNELESGSAPLEQSLKLYEEGVGLVGLCTGKLTAARQKVTELSLNAPGRVPDNGSDE